MKRVSRAIAAAPGPVCQQADEAARLIAEHYPLLREIFGSPAAIAERYDEAVKLALHWRSALNAERFAGGLLALSPLDVSDRIDYSDSSLER